MTLVIDEALEPHYSAGMPETGESLSDGIHGLTVDQRVAVGKQARQRVSRTSLGEYSPGDRPDPVQVLIDQEVGRVDALLPLRHQRMAANEFAFLRGAAALMARDLGSRPDTGLHAQLCGDAHLANLGIFAGPDRSLVFDLNDFDETARGPFEWDVMRLATSFLVAARHAGHSETFAASLPGLVANAYRDSVTMFAGMNDLDIWYYRIDTALMRTWAQRHDSASASKALRATEGQAQARDRWSAIRKLTHLDGGVRRFNDQPPLLTSLGYGDDARTIVESMYGEYKDSLQVDRRELLHRYQIIDVGHKVVGVGSVGLLAFVLLLQGRDDSDLLVLQVKQAVESVLAPFTGIPTPQPPGRRVVYGQQFMQATSDAFLGWVTGPRGRSYYVRQLRDMKWSPDLDTMTKRGYRAYAGLCGATLARAHARAGDPIAIAAYVGTSDSFASAVTRFAHSYAEQNHADYQAFVAAIASGRIDADEASVDVGLTVDTEGNVELQSRRT